MYVCIMYICIHACKHTRIYTRAQDIAPGDMIVVATDGVWDNVYEEDMARIVREKREKPHKIAPAISALSQKHGQDRVYWSPFAASAHRQVCLYVCMYIHVCVYVCGALLQLVHIDRYACMCVYMYMHV